MNRPFLKISNPYERALANSLEAAPTVSTYFTIPRVTSEQARKLAKTPRCGVFCFSPLFLQFFSVFQKKILTNRKNCIILYKKVEAHRLMSMQSYQRLPRRRSQKGSVAEDGTRQSTDLAGGIKSPTVVAAMRRAIHNKTHPCYGSLCLFWW